MTKKASIIMCFNAWNELVTKITIDFISSIIDNTTYPNYDIILYENNSKVELLKKITDYLEDLTKKKLNKGRRITLIKPIGRIWYNMNREYNDAARISDAEILVFANNDMKIIDGYWLSNAITWLDNNSGFGLSAPHTNITFGNFFNCPGCPCLSSNSGLFSCLFTEGCLRKHSREYVATWNREWPTMGIYVCYRDALEKVGMHNPEIDLHAQDLDTILRFEMAGYRPVVAMDSLVEHYGGTGHQTLDVIASDGTSDYDFRSIRAYDVIYGYIYRPENVLRIKELHPLLVNALDKWRKEYWNDTNGVFNFEKRELYNKWVEWHRDEWKNGSLEKLKKKVEIIVYE